MRVDLVVTAPGEILTRFYPNGKLGGLTFEGPAPCALGQLIELRVTIEKPAREFIIKGQLAWARHKGSKNLKGSYGIDFVDGDDATARLLAFARSDLSPEATRIALRLATDLPVRISHHDKTRRETLADLSQGGAFVQSPNPAELGDTLELHLRPPGSLTSMVIKARVAWIRRRGDLPGMGLEFFDADAKVLERLNKLLARLEKT